VCVAVTERADEAEQMAKVVKLLSMTVDTPIMIDSTEPNVIQRALEAIPGRAIINSINMENGRERIDAVVPLAKKHGAALVALTIDPIGMAKTRDRKLEVAKKIYDIVVGEYGLAPQDLIYDDLTFTLATNPPNLVPGLPGYTNDKYVSVSSTGAAIVDIGIKGGTDTARYNYTGAKPSISAVPPDAVSVWV
jgi:5-methyltetrahydrofolate--homocysteine methyltransferase